MSLTDIFGPPISTYTRAQATEDGELIDTSATAREAGITFPLALTRAVWAEYVAVPKSISCQDESGRLWDIVWMLRIAIARSRSNDPTEIRYSLYVRNTNRQRLDRRDFVTLKAVCGPGDGGEPVITVMLPSED
jgi:uncharacterized protein DUF6573